MECPRCRNDLEARHQGGVEIDVCRRCGGVWLDRGEMDKLVYEDDEAVIGAPEDAPAVTPPPAAPSVERGRQRSDDRSRDRRRHDDDDDDDDDDDRRVGMKRTKRKKESFVERLADALEDIFD